MAKQTYSYIIKESKEKEDLLNFYLNKIENWVFEDPQELQKKALGLLEEIEREVRFVGPSWNIRWEGFLFKIKEALNEKFAQIAGDSSPDAVKKVSEVLNELGLNNLSEILELKTEISKLRNRYREKERRYERIKKTFEKMGWILEVKPRERSVNVFRRKDKYRREIFKRIEKMRKIGGKGGKNEF